MGKMNFLAIAPSLQITNADGELKMTDAEWEMQYYKKPLLTKLLYPFRHAADNGRIAHHNNTDKRKRPSFTFMTLYHQLIFAGI